MDALLFDGICEVLALIVSKKEGQNDENWAAYFYTILNEIDFENGERIMNRKITVSILLLTILASCAAPETEILTQVAVLESPPPPTPPVRADIGDGGLLSGLPCPSPCVFGIRIGETPLDQVIHVLEENGLSACQREDSVSWIAITCGYSVSVQVYTQTNIVNATWFYPSSSVSLGEIIERYGDPNFISLQVDGPTEAPTSRMHLYWDSLQMTVEMPEINSHIYALEKTTNVEAVIFLDEEQYMDSSKVPFGEYYKRWNGYDTYQP